ncbi:MAG: hypothetical protein COS98_02155 [Parcubacteria group bacterium CG07_land_8_20_14_0_80_35_11]|nr:MAG: hypothetical protein COS98_02155 [Parcubacteria group bacterium CG07_land_8_20_14_0_80_35_11]
MSNLTEEEFKEFLDQLCIVTNTAPCLAFRMVENFIPSKAKQFENAFFGPFADALRQEKNRLLNSKMSVRERYDSYQKIKVEAFNKHIRPIFQS